MQIQQLCITVRSDALGRHHLVPVLNGDEKGSVLRAFEVTVALGL